VTLQSYERRPRPSRRNVSLDTNDFTGTQANAVRKFIKEANSGVELVFDEGAPTETSSYSVLLKNIRASNPDAVLHLGYPSNDIAFLRNVQDSGIKFKFLFCIYPGLEAELLEKMSATRG
jgi:branched-chain amino acid transport system substrate-binding protein